MFCPEIPLANASFTYSPCGPFTQKQTKKKPKQTNKQTKKYKIVTLILVIFAFQDFILQ